MPSTPSRTRKRKLEVDWVVVSVEGARRWGLLTFLALLSIAILVAVYLLLHEPVDRKALRTLRRATAVEEQLSRSGVSDSLRGEFEQASRLLEQARGDCDAKQYPACLARAADSLRRFELLSGLAGSDFAGSGQIIAMHGKVEVQRANQSKWDRAKEKQPLYNGDFIKTASDANAEIIFSDGTIYRLGPDTLMEVHREARSGKQPTSGEVKLTVGQVNVFTALNQSVVLTDAARAEVDRDSRVGVDVSQQDRSATVAAYSGTAKVTTASGQSADLQTRQAIRASSAGELGERQIVPSVPAQLEPPPNALIDLDANDRVTLRWRPEATASGYDLQVSRSRVFGANSLEVVANDRPESTATVKVLRPGVYYWRVASVGNANIRSEWSAPRAFKAYAGKRIEELADTTPPKLDVAKPTQIGNLFLIQGQTEPGAIVTINGEPVDVAVDGTFKKAIALHQTGAATIVIRATDPAGNTSEHTEPVFLEAE